MEILRPWWLALLVFTILIVVRYVGWLRWRRRVLVRRRGWGTPLKPYALALSAGNELFVTDEHKSVWIYNLNGRLRLAATAPSKVIRGLTLSPTTPQAVLVADADADRIHVLDTKGKAVGSIRGTLAGQDVAPHGLLFLPNGHLLVCDNRNLGLVEYDSKAQLLNQAFAPQGSKLGQVDRPRQMAYDPTRKEIYVADRDNDRVQVFDLTRKAIREFGNVPSAKGGKLNQPHGVALDPAAGIVYVGDTYNGRIAVYTTAGRFLCEYKDSAFGRPRWMAVDPKTRRQPPLPVDRRV
jgi:DNA-binding beta-propeller fold protein YncE